MNAKEKERQVVVHTQTLCKAAAWYNPFHVFVNNRWYEIQNIFLYRNGDEPLEIGRGWFGNNNQLERLDIPLVIVRNKPVYDGKSFIIRKQSERFENRTTYKCVLYIPAAYFDLEKSEHREKIGYQTFITPFYKSKWEPEIWFLDYKNRIKEEDENQLKQVSEMVAEKLKLLNRIVELDNSIRELDPYRQVEEMAKKGIEQAA
jgi:hypothetical protein